MEGFPWVSVSCQTNGAHIWFPCKEHPNDKANGAEIIITSPEQLTAVGNGLLISKEKQQDRWVKWHWETKYPISTYNINFAIGKFELVETTSYLFEEPLKIEYYVLPEKITGANSLIREAKNISVLCPGLWGISMDKRKAWALFILHFQEWNIRLVLHMVMTIKKQSWDMILSFS